MSISVCPQWSRGDGKNSYDKFVNQLGGIKTLEQGLDETCPLYTYPGGVVIQAGPYPQIGDLEKGIQLKDYQKVYRLVKPVQAEYDNILLRTPRDVDDVAFTRQWLHRFEWPTGLKILFGRQKALNLSEYTEFVAVAIHVRRLND